MFFSDELPTHQIALKRLKDSSSLMRYMVTVAHVKIVQVSREEFLILTCKFILQCFVPILDRESGLSLGLG